MHLLSLKLLFWSFFEADEVLDTLEAEQTEVPPIRRPTKDSQWMGPKETAVIHHRQQMKTKMKYKADEPKTPRTKLVSEK